MVFLTRGLTFLTLNNDTSIVLYETLNIRAKKIESRLVSEHFGILIKTSEESTSVIVGPRTGGFIVISYSESLLRLNL